MTSSHLDRLDVVTWIVLTLSPGSSQRHHSSPTLPKVQCWVDIPRSRQISYSLSRLALSVSNFSIHSPQRPTSIHAFPNVGVGVGYSSCLDLARRSSLSSSFIKQADPHTINQLTHSSSHQSRMLVVFGSLPSTPPRLFLLLH